MSEAIAVAWRKSSRSTQDGSNGACVEVGFAAEGVVVRDSKCPGAGMLRYPERGWSAFLTTCCRAAPR